MLIRFLVTCLDESDLVGLITFHVICKISFISRLIIDDKCVKWDYSLHWTTVALWSYLWRSFSFLGYMMDRFLGDNLLAPLNISSSLLSKRKFSSDIEMIFNLFSSKSLLENIKLLC